MAERLPMYSSAFRLISSLKNNTHYKDKDIEITEVLPDCNTWKWRTSKPAEVCGDHIDNDCDSRVEEISLDKE